MINLVLEMPQTTVKPLNSESLELVGNTASLVSFP